MPIAAQLVSADRSACSVLVLLRGLPKPVPGGAWFVMVCMWQAWSNEAARRFGKGFSGPLARRIFGLEPASVLFPSTLGVYPQ